jgi:hypothetical protein
MIVQLDKAITDCNADESVKILLRQIVSALNALDNGRGQVSKDLVFRDANSGVVGQGTDGNYYRATLTTSGATVSWAFENLGKERPQ